MNPLKSKYKYLIIPIICVYGNCYVASFFIGNDANLHWWMLPTNFTLTMIGIIISFMVFDV